MSLRTDIYLGRALERMTTSKQQDGENRDKGRVSLARPVRLRYRRFQEFLQEASANISIGGMFIATEEPHEPGSQFDFELSREDGFSLVKGRAEVVWIRAETAGLSQPAGMGVRFLHLEGASRKLIAKVVEKYRRKGREPFELGRSAKARIAAARAMTDSGSLVPGSEAVLGVDSRGAGAAAGKSEMAQRLRRFAGLALVAVVAGLFIVLGFHNLYVRPRIDELERRLEDLSARGVQPGATGVDTSDDSLVEPGDQLETDGNEMAALEPLERVEQWARSWSDQRVDDYLAFYSAAFQPDAGMSREEWEAMRRARILRHSGIRVQILLAEETKLGADESQVEFTQSYHSENYDDRVKKTLRLVREEGVWKIAEERVARALPD